MNNTNPYRYKLPTAETGMNIRGPRNQLVKQEKTEKNVGSWFRDAGKWLLNTMVSPIELITGTNFYDPEMAHSGWQGFDDVFEGTAKGVGDALGYVYGGPMYAGIKEAGSGIADAAGLEDQVAGAQYGGKIKKAQNGNQYGTPISTQSNLFSMQFPSGPAGAAQMEQMSQGIAGVLEGTQHFCQGGNCHQNLSGTTPTSGQDYFKNMQHGSQYMSGPDSAQGWSGAVMEAASDPVGATTNLIGGIANAGKDPVVAKDYKTYRDITSNTGSHPGDLIKSTADIIAGIDPVEYAFTEKNKNMAKQLRGAQQTMKASPTMALQMGGTIENPQARAHILDATAKSQGGMNNMANKVGQAIQHIGGTVGESLSGLGMGGGGGEGMMGMFGGGGGQGGGMGNMMNMFGGGEGGGGFMDMFGGMMGGGEGGEGFNMSNIMSMFGGQNGGRVPVRKGNSPYIATYYYQDGTEVQPAPRDQLLKVDRSKVTPEMIRASNAQQMSMLDQPNVTKTSPATEQERLDAMMNANSDASRLRSSFGGSRDTANPIPNDLFLLGIDSTNDFLNQGVSNEDFLNQPFQNGGRLEKTSNLPMDMQGFTDLEPGFRRSNMIEINSGNSHSDLKNPHTPLNVPVPSFDGQGNAMTENVPILAEKGEFARKDPETGAVTIFSKNLGFAKPAEKLGKKEEKLLEKAKNPYDDISDATVQRALSNIKNQFIRLEEEQKIAKELKEEEDRMDLFELAKNGGRITKKNTYRKGGRVKKLSEYQKDLLGMNDQEQIPMAQGGASFEDLTPYNRWKRLAGLDPDERKKEIEEIKKERKQNREARKKNRKEERKQRREGRDFQKSRTRGDTEPSDLAQEIADIPDGADEVNTPYVNEGAREAAEKMKEGLDIEKLPHQYPPCPPCEDGSIPKRDLQGNCEECYSLVPEDEEELGQQQQQQQRRGSGTNAINDYIRNLRNINAAVEDRFEPYPNFFEDYGRESESIARNALTDLPEWYMDRASQLASANVNSLENAIRNMGQSMGTSGYLAQMQAAKNKELAANQAYAAQAAGQREQQLGLISNLIAQNELQERTGAETSFDRTQEALDAIDAAKYDTEKNILTARLAQEREANAARRNELLDAQMQWMYRNDPTTYDEEGNEETTSSQEYGGKIKRNMYEYGSRVKKERQKKADRAIEDFRSFMKDYNRK